MRVFVIAIKDRALDAFMRPMFVPARALAVRSFTDELNRKDTPMNSHPDDYDMYQIAEFIEETGEFILPDNPELIVRGKDVLKPIN